MTSGKIRTRPGRRNAALYSLWDTEQRGRGHWSCEGVSAGVLTHCGASALSPLATLPQLCCRCCFNLQIHWHSAEHSNYFCHLLKKTQTQHKRGNHKSGNAQCVNFYIIIFFFFSQKNTAAAFKGGHLFMHLFFFFFFKNCQSSSAPQTRITAGKQRRSYANTQDFM